jgi:hypothetical protein
MRDPRDIRLRVLDLMDSFDHPVWYIDTEIVVAIIITFAWSDPRLVAEYADTHA